jgi:hypothetical protein
LFKVADRVTLRGHHIPQQLVRLRYRTGLAINEARLHSAPELHDTRAITCRERMYVRLFDSLFTLFEPRFRLPPTAVLVHGASMFSVPELSAQPSSSTLPEQKKRGDDCNENHHGSST